MVRVAQEGLSKQGFDQCHLRVVLNSEATFLLHNFSFCLELVHVKKEALHSICLKFQGEFNTVRSQILKVSGEVLISEGVVHPAVFSDEARESTRGILGRSLKHHMLEHVRESCPAHQFVP